MEQEIIISQDNNQNIIINSNEPQLLNVNNILPQSIDIKLNKNQNMNINQTENQVIIIGENGSYGGISDVLVNGVSVVSNGIAYVIVPTKLSELENDKHFITSEVDPTVPTYIKEITLSDINSWNNKQDNLVSGVNIKTINSNSILGNGNLNISTSYTAGNGININNENIISNTITSYNDLSDLPDIPTKLSELTNDEDFVRSDELSEVAFNGDYNALSNIPDIPTNTSDLINDSGFVSETDYASSLHGGTIKTGVNSYDINSVGQLYADTQTYATYSSMADTNFIGKGTLENVFTGKGFITNNYQIYSTTETRVGTWINNKPIYRKVITGTKNSGTDYSTTLDNTLDTIVSLKGILIPNGNTNISYPIPQYESSTVFTRIQLSKGTSVSTLKLVSGTSNYSNGEITLIIEYTKTTD